MTHDPLCPRGNPEHEDDTHPDFWCKCLLIAKVREDTNASQLTMWNRTQEQTTDIIEAAAKSVWIDGYAEGRKDMLAKCIALLSQERDKWFALLEDTARRSEYHNMSWHRCQDLINRISSDMSLLEELQEKP